ncbi:lysophospholipase L1-like esterase [Planifilum fimeticola]|uniref:Lysophospholipase L1-like esterase n=1 Tax=Planifilum fimeticola TaxID=201975 RepID=A0A2T0LCU2_9BACL|nr:SGNH/GDSL hydrolase family protein [Planifilum fimeticola]PRX39784.1 lysophospholipase L1-like esterase [Planifilum fimeticola]
MKPFHYVAFGDSITAGYSAPRRRGFVDMLGFRLGSRFPRVRVANCGKKGATSGDLLFYMTFSPFFHSALRRADLMTLWIGGNDLLHAYLKMILFRHPDAIPRSMHRYGHHLDRLIGVIRRANRSPLLLLNLYNPFPLSPLAVHRVEVMNAIIDGVASRWNIPVIDIHDRFLGREPFLIDGFRTGSLSDYRLLGENPIHPNGEGHRVIAEAVWEKING